MGLFYVRRNLCRIRSSFSRGDSGVNAAARDMMSDGFRHFGIVGLADCSVTFKGENHFVGVIMGVASFSRKDVGVVDVEWDSSESSLSV